MLIEYIFLISKINMNQFFFYLFLVFIKYFCVAYSLFHITLAYYFFFYIIVSALSLKLNFISMPTKTIFKDVVFCNYDG